MGGRPGRAVAALLITIAGAAGAQPARAPVLQAMAHVRPGLWELHPAGSIVPPRASCVADPAVLLRLRQRADQCTRFVIDDSPGGATVHYTCPGAGHVRTQLRVDTPRALFIRSEGIVNGTPFSDAIEARRVGDCR
ncbi:hypothetical protein [Sphingomonas sp. VNH70]|uniref:DUF3617 domain-containing protein n=1 Tax=Sphingomonas silueang TaxID=3156617 RepID=UPI0032B553FA